MKMDQANSAGAHPTGSDLQQQTRVVEYKCPCLMIRCKNQIGGIKHTCQVITLESRSGVDEGSHLPIRQKPQVNPFNLLLRCRCS